MFGGTQWDDWGYFGLMNKEGEYQWGYSVNSPVKHISVNKLETLVSIVMLYEEYAAEIHQYNLSDGSVSFLYELQGGIKNVFGLFLQD